MARLTFLSAYKALGFAEVFVSLHFVMVSVLGLSKIQAQASIVINESRTQLEQPTPVSSQGDLSSDRGSISIVVA